MAIGTQTASARRSNFEAILELIVAEQTEYLHTLGVPVDAIDVYRNSLIYNVPGGKLTRGMSVVDTVEILKGEPLDQGEYFKAALLGWCIELLQAYFLVADDIVDSSIMRRGRPCWYRLPHVGLKAIKDCAIVQGAVYQLLKAHFRLEPYYIDLVDLFHETTYQTEMGQLIDLITAPEDKVNLSKFSLERHRLIVIYKTAFYSFYLPVACALLVSKIPYSYSLPSGATVQPFDVSRSILIPLGEYFQIQDDFLDFSGTPEQIGKIGTDIVDNKCSWVVNTAIRLANPEQRKILDENYGRKDAEKEKVVKALFEELKIRDVYAEYEEKVVSELRQKIGEIVEVPGGLKKEVFNSFLDKIYKRKK
ncbi:hypothetical protein D9613_007033 [Agrocybe pediades]|uniref:(2E,6E)-farnesyl diphosphate synthase n=1 Tax=Agrocybe pediades TaxID=84607 RepID=A0A8H4VJQ7_9AGAR|nr:hypothetical protein D9613_007033 [Agrocybe pediades]